MKFHYHQILSQNAHLLGLTNSFWIWYCHFGNFNDLQGILFVPICLYKPYLKVLWLISNAMAQVLIVQKLCSQEKRQAILYPTLLPLYLVILSIFQLKTMLII